MTNKIQWNIIYFRLKFHNTRKVYIMKRSRLNICSGKSEIVFNLRITNIFNIKCMNSLGIPQSSCIQTPIIGQLQAQKILKINNLNE